LIQACAWLYPLGTVCDFIPKDSVRFVSLEHTGGRAAHSALSGWPVLLKHLPLSCFAELAFRCAFFGAGLRFSDWRSVSAALDLVNTALILLERGTRTSDTPAESLGDTDRPARKGHCTTATCRLTNKQQAFNCTPPRKTLSSHAAALCSDLAPE